jgi:hypothetical protein
VLKLLLEIFEDFKFQIDCDLKLEICNNYGLSQESRSVVCSGVGDGIG